MTERLIQHIDMLIERYTCLSTCKDDIISAYNIMEEAYLSGRKLLVAGNGGSASDSEHIVGELMKEFKLKRKIYSAQSDRLNDRRGNGEGIGRTSSRLASRHFFGW